MSLSLPSTTPVIIQSDTDEEVVFDAKFIELSDFVKNAPIQTDPFITDISTEHLNWIKTFCEKHNYSASSMTYTFPTVVNYPRGNICEISYELLARLYVEGNIQETAKRIAPYIRAADQLQFRKLFTTLNVFLISPLHIDDSEDSIQQFMRNFNLTDKEDFSGDKISQAVKDNCEMFELVVQRFMKNVKVLDEIQGIQDE